MDLEVVGRHALLFDDDSNAAFVNSQEALVEWNSLLIDRYDVRHLLSIPLPPLKKRLRSSSSSSSSPSSVEPEIDEERYLDLPPPSDENQDESSALQESNNGAERATGGIYNAVAFSYGNSIDQKDLDTGLGDSSFVPPFPVPESLLQNLPLTEKLHQIMARTAVFVSKHGGQSEIVLRVKQGDNPTFGFLMPDHHLHAYFRFLVDHPEVLKSDMDGKLQKDHRKTDNEQNHMANVSSGALSLLGSAYESGEDEDDDGSPQDVNESVNKKTGDSTNRSDATHSQPEQAEVSLCSTEKNEGVHKHSLAAAKEKILSVKRNRSVTGVTTSNKCSKKMESDAVGPILTTAHKPQTSGISKFEPLILEPPSEVKRTMDKIVEFILRNGKQFEAVLIEQDAKNGRFPFLLPSNQYHSYYLRVLEKAQELKQAGKSLDSQKLGLSAPVGGKAGASAKDNDPSSEVPGSQDKEKFKMVISGVKKDASESVPKPAKQCGVSVDAAAAILQAARRGIRNPKLDILPSKSLDEPSVGLSGEGGGNTSFGSLSLTSRARSSTPKLVSGVAVGEPSNTEAGKTSFASVVKAIAKTAALAAATEADSSEAYLTKEQKQKAERLKRAKMFAAMLKGGVAPLVDAASPSLSAEPPDSAYSVLQTSAHRASSLNGPTQSPDTANNLGDEVEDLAAREREGSSVPVDIDTSGKVENFKKRDSDDDDYKEKRTRMKHHLRSRRHVEDEDDDDDDRDHRHSRKKHRSRHSSHNDRDERSHRKRHSSSKDGESRHRHRHHSSSEDEHHHRSRSEKHRRRSHKERKVESEDEEIDTKRSVKIGDSASRGASVDLLDDRRERSSSLVADAQPTGTTEVSDDLRAKVRAMLLATM